MSKWRKTHKTYSKLVHYGDECNSKSGTRYLTQVKYTSNENGRVRSRQDHPEAKMHQPTGLGQVL